MENIRIFLERIAERQSSFVLFGDRIYSIDIVSNTNGNTNHPDYMHVSGVNGDQGLIFSLVPSVQAHYFEKLDERIYASTIHEQSAAYVNEQINQELKAEEAVKKEQSRIKTLNFVMHEFLPFLVSKKYDDEDTLHSALNGDKDANKVKGPMEKAREEIAAKLNHDFGTDADVAAEDPGERMRLGLLQKEKAKLKHEPVVKEAHSLEEMAVAKKELLPSTLGEITAHQPFYIVDGAKGKAIPLRLRPAKAGKGEAKLGEAGLVFRINNNDYIPAPVDESIPVATLLQELRERRVQEWRVEAIEKSQGTFAMIRDLVKTRDITQRQMHELAKLKEYAVNGCGFVIHDNDYYVYATVPKFATQDGRKPDRFWPFDATRIAIKVGWSDGKPYTSDHALVIDSRPHHPCLRHRTDPKGFCGLCNLDERYNNTHKLMEMVAKLSDAANVFLEPMNKPSLDSHSEHNYFGDSLDSILKQKPMIREEAEKEGYVVVEVINKKV